MEPATQTKALPSWEYFPPIEYGEKVQSIGGSPGLRVVFYNNLQSTGSVHYRYLATVYLGDTMFPLFMVTAETSDMLPLEGKGEWALGVFRPEGHAAVDISDDYGHWFSFLHAAMVLIKQEFPDSSAMQAGQRLS